MTEARRPYRSRLVAGLLALFVGFSGLHRRYLGQWWWPIYPLIALPAIGLALRNEVWFQNPGFYVASLVVVVAMLEAVLFSIAPDEKWDARHNPDYPSQPRAGWSHVFVAIVALMLGSILLMSVMAISFEALFSALKASREGT